MMEEHFDDDADAHWNMRSKHITREELCKRFHLPIAQVAQELGVCATVLKKKCRQHGIPRWPFRKLKSLDKLISALEKTNPKSSEDRLRTAQELDALRTKRKFIMENPAVLAIGSSSATKPVPHQSPSASLPRQALRVGSSIQNGGVKRKGVRECLRNTPRLEHALFAHLSRALVRLQHLRNDAPHAGDSDSE